MVVISLDFGEQSDTLYRQRLHDTWRYDTIVGVIRK